MDDSHPSFIFLSRFFAALGRILSVAGATVAVESEDGLQPVLDDIWRLSVVTLHASFEAALRDLVRQQLYSSPKVAAATDIGKMRLEVLLENDRLSLDEGYRKTVDDYLARQSLSRVGHIDRWIRLAGIDVSSLDLDRAALSRLIERRHEIVHLADLNSEGEECDDCDEDVLMAWIGAVGSLVCQVFAAGVSREVAQGAMDPEPARQLLQRVDVTRSSLEID